MIDKILSPETYALLGQWALGFCKNLVIAIIVFFIGRWLIKWASRMITKLMQRANVEISSTYKILANTPWIQLDNNGFIYDGTEKKPAVTLKFNGTTIPSTEYTVAYTNNVNVPANSDNANAPTVTVTIKESCQDYAGSAKAYFAISPAPSLAHWLQP